jgi:hypothetical protein
VIAAPLVDPVDDTDLLEERQIALEMHAARRAVREAGPTDQHAGTGGDGGVHAGSTRQPWPRPYHHTKQTWLELWGS